MVARIKVIAPDASTMPDERNSTFSDRWAGVSATTSLGSRRAVMVARPNSTMPITSGMPTAALPRSARGPMASAPTTPEIRPSFEFASTSSSSLRTTVGTSADLETAYVFCITSAPNTRG